MDNKAKYKKVDGCNENVRIFGPGTKKLVFRRNLPADRQVLKFIVFQNNPDQANQQAWDYHPDQSKLRHWFLY